MPVFTKIHENKYVGDNGVTIIPVYDRNFMKYVRGEESWLLNQEPGMNGTGWGWIVYIRHAYLSRQPIRKIELSRDQRASVKANLVACHALRSGWCKIVDDEEVTLCPKGGSLASPSQLDQNQHLRTAARAAFAHDVSTPENTLVLYSGERNWEAAKNFVAQHPEFLRIDETPAGQRLNGLIGPGSEYEDLLTDEHKALLWGVVSERLVASARGEVSSFSHGSGEESIFRNIEARAAITNEGFSHLNERHPQTHEIVAVVPKDDLQARVQKVSTVEVRFDRLTSTEAVDRRDGLRQQVIIVGADLTAKRDEPRHLDSASELPRASPEGDGQEIEAQSLREVQESAVHQHQREEEQTVEKPTWEQVEKAEQSRRAKELQDQREAQQLALKDMMTGVEKRGNDPVERDQIRRAFEEQCKQQLADKLREQQERMDRLELLYKGPPSGRERG